MTGADGDMPWRVPDRPVRCGVVGVGQRGNAFVEILSRLPGVAISWLVDRSPDRMAECLDRTGLRRARCTANIAKALADPDLDAVFIALPDYLHHRAAVRAFDAGKHVFLEKPIATTAPAARALLRAWKRSRRFLHVGYVLRHAPFYQTIREVVRSGAIGPVRSLSLTEHLTAAHGTSYLRRWHRLSRQSGGLIVHKGCHDLDLICWLLDTRPVGVASFGALTTFARPAPAPFCSQCPERPICPYADTGAYEKRCAAEQSRPSLYGLDRCVFGQGKDVIDTQIVAFELAGGVCGSFHLTLQGRRDGERRIALIGDRGRIEGDFVAGRFEVIPIDDKSWVWTDRADRSAGHGGGDERAVIRFLDTCLARQPPELTDPADVLRGLVFATSAEAARRSRREIRLSARDFSIAAEMPEIGPHRRLRRPARSASLAKLNPALTQARVVD